MKRVEQKLVPGILSLHLTQRVFILHPLSFILVPAALRCLPQFLVCDTGLNLLLANLLDVLCQTEKL